MKIIIIGDKKLVLGCALAGVKEGYVADDISTVREVFFRCMERTDIGIILIGEEVAEMIHDEIQNAKRSIHLIPVITVVPDISYELAQTGLQNQRDESVQEYLIK